MKCISFSTMTFQFDHLITIDTDDDDDDNDEIVKPEEELAHLICHIHK